MSKIRSCFTTLSLQKRGKKVTDSLKSYIKQIIYESTNQLLLRSKNLERSPNSVTIESRLFSLEVDLDPLSTPSEKPDLRSSLMLCQEEKDFIDVRKRRVHKAMKTHFGFGAPRNYQEVCEILKL